MMVSPNVVGQKIVSELGPEAYREKPPDPG
jgi:hypothetical protein